VRGLRSHRGDQNFKRGEGGGIKSRRSREQGQEKRTAGIKEGEKKGGNLEERRVIKEGKAVASTQGKKACPWEKKPCLTKVDKNNYQKSKSGKRRGTAGKGDGGEKQAGNEAAQG